jgi:hypothetical protein
MATTIKPKKLTAKQEERILNAKIRKMNADLASGALRYPAPEVWVPQEEGAARAELLAVLATVVLAA